METNELLDYFLDPYLPKQETVYRLPLSVSIKNFWPKELSLRRARAVKLPLRTADSDSYWYVPTRRLCEAGDRLSEIARYQATNSLPQYAHDEGILDEAFYSSAIEGAYTTRDKAKQLIANNKTPETLHERMIYNNYEALRFALEHLDSPINEAVTLEIARILTNGTLETKEKIDWRATEVQVVSGRQEVVYVAPSANKIRPMLDDLFAFLAQEDVHPIIKACAAHIYFVTVHPLADGNGRTARALSYMILLQAGYDFFRQVPISGLLSQERAKYYKAIRACQNPENGCDFTYFMEYYSDLLVRTLSDIHTHVKQKARIDELRQAAASLSSQERLCAGLEWLYAKGFDSITTAKWQEKHAVSFETARKDLNWLAEHGFLVLRTVGHKSIYDVIKD